MTISENKRISKKTASRPRIPAEVERAVLVQAGHRCSVCGDPCPLERAHIVPWRMSQKHDADDLILLCANCHQRADHENWGEKTLREYKCKPWILRKYEGNPPAKKTQRVKITLGLDLTDFEETRQRLLVYAIAAFLNISPEEVVITAIDEGSVKVTVQLPEDAARRLLVAFEARDVGLFALLSHSFLLDITMEPQEQLDQDDRVASSVFEFEEFIKKMEPRIKEMLVQSFVPVDDREDIAQQTLLALLYQWEGVRDPENWLLGTLQRHILMYQRSRRRSDQPIEKEDLSNQKAAPLEDLNKLFLRIPPLEAEVEVLRYIKIVARRVAEASN